jgi:hypothetical protein
LERIKAFFVGTNIQNRAQVLVIQKSKQIHFWAFLQPS